jgi:hypothetical protein
MDTMELIFRQVELATRTLNENTEAKRPPCQFTVEELKAEIIESLEDVRNGRVTTHEELEKEMIVW